MGIWDIFDSRDKRKQLSHTKNPLALPCADGRPTEDETNLIFRMGITPV